MKKVGITFSTFDLLHAGHILMLEECKSNCDYLIVAIQSDPTIDRKEKNKPIQTLFERYTQLKAVKYVDEIVPYSTEKEVEDILLSRNINIRFLGEDYINKDFTGKKLCEENNIKIFFNSRKHSYSSTELRKRIKNERV
jgi:glycerol-3-phosphate cytidylyltransferase